MLPLIKDWNSAVLFPGFLGLVLALSGAVIALAANDILAAPSGHAIAKRPFSTDRSQS